MGNLSYLGNNVDVRLTNFALAYGAGGKFYAADLILPIVPTKDLEGTYQKSMNKALRLIDTKRRAGSPAKRVSNDTEDANYKCHQHSAAVEIDRATKIRTIAAGDDPMQLATEDVMDAINVAREKECSDTVFNSTTFTSHYTSLSGANRWDTSTSVPFKNLNTARSAIIQGIGEPPDLLAMPYDVMLAFFNHDEYLARLGSLGIKEPSIDALRIMLGKEQMAFEDIIILPATYNTSVPKSGEAFSDQTFDFIWANGVFIGKKAKNYSSSRKKVNTFGVTFQPEGFTGLQIESREDLDLQLDIVEGNLWYGQTIVNAAAGYYFGTPITR